MLKSLLTLLLLSLSHVTLAAERPIRFSINESWGMPLVRIEQGQVVGGILVDLQQRMAAKLGRTAEFLIIPRLRVQQALDSGEVDVRCYVSPNWVNGNHSHHIWTLPFMTQRDLLLGTAPEKLEIEQLHNERLGAVLGFSYPRLEPLFASGQLKRDDARTQDQVLLKLSAQRYRYAISNELSLRWFNSQHPPEQKLHALSEVSADPMSCIIRDAVDVPTMALLRAMVQMKEDGEFEALLARYR